MNELTINLDEIVMNIVTRRAKRNLLTPKKLIEDIVRRSMLSYKDSGKSAPQSNIDDKLLNIFSRQRRGRKKIKKIINKNYSKK
ncbi:MAG: hypothetical protein Q7S27_07505 [Nanoarchaeota archaeon]|nr:hypothetical protein [Nanoarchaeota archaeon]